MKSLWPFLSATLLLTLSVAGLFAEDSKETSVIGADPETRKAVRAAEKAKYVSPKQSEKKLIADLQKGNQEFIKEHQNFIGEHECSPDSFRVFSRDIQPILFNSCATGACHGSAQPTSELHFQVPRSRVQITPTTTRRHFSQTLRFIDKEEPERSTLLQKALEPHGNASRPPLSDRESAAYRSLEAWVMYTAQPTAKRRPMKTDAKDNAVSNEAMDDEEDVQTLNKARSTVKRSSPQVRQVPIKQINTNTLDSGTKPESKSAEKGKEAEKPSFFNRLLGRKK